jgi:hypothetical protein
VGVEKPGAGRPDAPLNAKVKTKNANLSAPPDGLHFDFCILHYMIH